MESDVSCMQQQVMGDPTLVSSQFMCSVQCAARKYIGQNTTALKVPGRSLSRVLVEPNLVRLP